MAFYENTIIAKQNLSKEDLIVVKEKYNQLINNSEGKVLKLRSGDL